jgi:hypothetical protein
MFAHQRGIAPVLVRDEDALNASNTDGVMPLYAEDALFMPPCSPSAVDSATVRQADESVAFARTNSTGTVMVNTTGVKSAEVNQELLIFTRDHDGARPIARDSFSSINPPLA